MLEDKGSVPLRFGWKCLESQNFIINNKFFKYKSNRSILCYIQDLEKYAPMCFLF